MKRIHTRLVGLFLASALLFSLPLPSAFAAGGGQKSPDSPRLYLTHVPQYGSNADVAGKVAFPDGSPIDPDAYRVTLFLQVPDSDAYWIKPTYARPYVTLREDGSFLLDYTTGGIDEKAVKLHIFLIRSNYEPSKFEDARLFARDYVRVERSTDGDNVIYPSSATERAPALNPVYAPELIEAKDAALTALTERLRAESDSFYVYRDFGDTRNHFTQKAKMAGWDDTLVKDMDENWQIAPYAGISCIRCEQDTSALDWGGWLFLNGTLKKGDTTPQLNDGKKSKVGFDLTGADALHFFAKGDKGGEIVEFFTAGFGYNGETGKKQVKYPDSARKQSLGFVTLTKDWREYVIPLEDVDLRNICCGFGYILSGIESGSGSSVLYLDEIRFTGSIKAVKEAPVMLRSYDTDNIYIKNAAFSYDNALAAMAFLSANMLTEAAAILDAFVYAVENDRFASDRVRNAYAAGDISAFPGWNSGARLPGWYDMNEGETGAWFEDRYQVGCNVGNTSYVALALLQYNSVRENKTYLKTAEKLMNWVLKNCQDGTPGFTAGYEGWPEGKPPVVYPLTYKSIEHNIDAYAAFSHLYALTKKRAYQKAADSALTFIKSMYDEEAGVFDTGTLDDGVTPNKGNVVLDAQVWGALALGEDFAPYGKSLDRVEAMKTEEGGYPFCEANANGGWWAEGTAFTALLLRLRGENDNAATALNALASIQLENGLFPAATVDDLSTGFGLFTGEDWTYDTAAHVAPTAWFVMAANGFNPYVFE